MSAASASVRDAAGHPPSALPRLPALPPSVPRSGVGAPARQALRQLVGDIDRQFGEAFAAGLRAEDLVRARSSAVERILAHVWTAFVGETAAMALFAVGGFGRGELFPHSDVDLLVLTEDSPHETGVRGLERFFACLWDIGLKPGSAVRSAAQCRELAARDATVYTSLLDGRFLLGGKAFAGVPAALCADDGVMTPERFFAAKRAEEETRRARYDDTAYNLEPNLKEGPGGLRALQLMLWLGQRLFGAPTLAALAQRGLIADGERRTAEASRARLYRFRYALHLVAGRAEERLLFDYQRELARRLGYSDEHAQNLGVEQFMQDYFRAAIAIARLNEGFVQRCEEALDPAPRHTAPRRLSVDFVEIGGRLNCEPADLLLRRPAALIDLFRVWGDHPQVKRLSADLMRRIDEALLAVGPRLPLDTEVNAAFARLLRKGASAVEALVRMNRHGVLAQYLPAFGRIVGRMQYDLFHVYTVDEHTMRVLRIVAKFADAQESRDFALAHELFGRLPRPELLILAALFHDIAKGRGGDHSVLGEEDARECGERLGLPAADVDLVAWLVRQHLSMSVVAQTQDIADAEVVHRFAVAVADSERLDYLYLLTMADIAGTSAKVWNSWKSRLLRDLYTSARYMLREGLERPPLAAERAAAARSQARALLLAHGIDASMIERIWADFPEEAFLRFRPDLIAWQTRGIAMHGDVYAPLTLIDAQGPRGGSEVFVHARDGDGLFAAVAAVFDRLRLSVFEARILTSRSGMGMDSFLVLDQYGRMLDAPTLARLRGALDEALRQTPYPTQAGAAQPMSRLRHFPVPLRVEFRQDAAGQRTQLALVCADRPGLLAAIALTFRECQARVHDARIATFGERAEDFFLLTDHYNRPLDAAARDALRAALVARLGITCEKTHAVT